MLHFDSMKARFRFFSLRSTSVAMFVWAAFFNSGAAGADNVSTLGTRPRWNVLEHYQRTITRDEFANLIQNVYCTQGMPSDMISMGPDSARILTNRESQTFFTLRFASAPDAKKPVPHLWRSAKNLGPASDYKPLLGLRIALDPGHVGGNWAKIEERWFKIGDSAPVQEGDLTLG